MSEADKQQPPRGAFVVKDPSHKSKRTGALFTLDGVPKRETLEIKRSSSQLSPFVTPVITSKSSHGGIRWGIDKPPDASQCCDGGEIGTSYDDDSSFFSKMTCHCCSVINRRLFGLGKADQVVYNTVSQVPSQQQPKRSSGFQSTTHIEL